MLIVNMLIVKMLMTNILIVKKQIANSVFSKGKSAMPPLFNPFVPNAPFLYPLKILENLKFSDVFRGGRERVHWKQMG